MTFKVELHPEYDYCPQWWKQLCSHYNHLKSDVETDNAIRSYITANGGTIQLDEDGDCIEYIEFPSEAHFTWFLLKI